MLNYVWAGMMVISVITAFFTNRLDETVAAAFQSAKDAVTLIISLGGIMCFFTGLMEIGERAGLIKLLSKVIKPFSRFLFPDTYQNEETLGAMCANITANVLGMSNAATPFGLNAMDKLQKLNQSSTASDSMCMFVVLNSASLQLIPTTMIALRSLNGSSDPGSIIPCVWIVSILALLSGILCARICRKFW